MTEMIDLPKQSGKKVSIIVLEECVEEHNLGHKVCYQPRSSIFDGKYLVKPVIAKRLVNKGKAEYAKSKQEVNQDA